jgi:hypothetical protein
VCVCVRGLVCGNEGNYALRRIAVGGVWSCLGDVGKWREDGDVLEEKKVLGCVAVRSGASDCVSTGCLGTVVSRIDAEALGDRRYYLGEVCALFQVKLGVCGVSALGQRLQGRRIVRGETRSDSGLISGLGISEIVGGLRCDPGGWERKEGEVGKPSGRRCDLKHRVELRFEATLKGASVESRVRSWDPGWFFAQSPATRLHTAIPHPSHRRPRR